MSKQSEYTSSPLLTLVKLNENRSLVTSIEEKNAQAQELLVSYTELQDTLENLNRRKEEETNGLQSMIGHLSSLVNEQKILKKQLHQQSQQLFSEQKSLVKKLNYQSQLDESERLSIFQTENFEQLSGEISKLEKTHMETLQELKKNKTLLEERQTCLSTRKGQVTQAKELLRKTQQTQKNLIADAKKREKTISNKAKKNEKNQSEINLLQQEKEHLLAEQQSLQKKLAEIEENHESFKKKDLSEGGEDESNHRNLLEEKHEAEEIVYSLKKNIKNIRKKTKNIQTQLLNQQAETEELTNNLAAEEEKNTRLKLEIEKLKREAEKFKKEAKSQSPSLKVEKPKKEIKQEIKKEIKEDKAEKTVSVVQPFTILNHLQNTPPDEFRVMTRKIASFKRKERTIHPSHGYILDLDSNSFYKEMQSQLGNLFQYEKKMVHNISTRYWINAIYSIHFTFEVQHIERYSTQGEIKEALASVIVTYTNFTIFLASYSCCTEKMNETCAELLKKAAQPSQNPLFNDIPIPPAFYLMAYFHENGDTPFFKRDLYCALRYYKLAADKNYGDAKEAVRRVEKRLAEDKAKNTTASTSSQQTDSPQDSTKNNSSSSSMGFGKN